MSETATVETTPVETPATKPSFADYEAKRRHEIYGGPKPEVSAVVEPVQAVDGQGKESKATESVEAKAVDPDEVEHKSLPPALREELKKLREERKALRAELDGFKRQAQTRTEPAAAAKTEEPAAKPEAKGKPVAPRLTDFKTLDEYEVKQAEHVEAVANWVADERAKVQAKEREQETAAKTNAEIQTAWDKRVEEASKKIPDIREHIEAIGTKVSTGMAHLIRTSEVGPQIVDYLAKHPEEMGRLAGIRTYLDIGREIGKIEALVSKSPEAKTTTRVLPNPPASLGGSTGAPTSVPRELALKKDFRAYEQARNAQLHRR
jgi:hypothetical protein